jgi:deoxyadenosine/deoxycytidine kinase
MGKLIAVVGASGVGKTSLVKALTQTGNFAVAFEQHTERPFQALFKRDPQYGLANQLDYLLYRTEQEKEIRSSGNIGLVDGGLDLDFQGFTRLFHARGLLSDLEFDLCHRFYV